ncbi:phosphotransferase family protein [Thermomonospora catenispora]|uniref:phosphotransferase family protein n=1 Tax=Thermomonospora catenispora TaxID=2493090 RepID=UPI0011246C48|nr:aminoglycoside phosphotransferase family protein [Thermomonospora catenispora]TNY35485.1 aminoglycoside phosphotransferase family protein [Thermomonospora catenispora]
MTDRSGDVRRLLAAHLPGRRAGSVSPLGEGEDHVAYEVDGELIVRFGKGSGAEGPARGAEEEARLLRAVAGLSPLPVPEPCFTAAQEDCLAYRRLPGVPLIDLSPWERPGRNGRIGAVLGALLRALHAARPETVAGLVGTDEQPRDLWLREAAEARAAVGDRVPGPHRAAVAEFLGAPPPTVRRAPVFSHNDLGIEHVLVDPATEAVTGIIDWSDAAFTDPGYDFGLLYRDLGPCALEAALDAYRAEGRDRRELRTLAVFYARCTALTDMAYGLDAGRAAYLAKGLAALRWLFPGRLP